MCLIRKLRPVDPFLEKKKKLKVHIDMFIIQLNLTIYLIPPTGPSLVYNDGKDCSNVSPVEFVFEIAWIEIPKQSNIACITNYYFINI